jgi:hypothetical protein
MSSTQAPSLSGTKLYAFFTAMREEVLKHKWIESEKANKDVGFEFALIDWIFNHKEEWRKRFTDLS